MPAMLPPEVESQYFPASLDGLHEPALWTPDALLGYRSRLRLTLSGLVRRKLAIRIDEDRAGRLFGHLESFRVGTGGRPRERRETRFVVNRSQWRALRQAAAEAELWAVHPQFYLGSDRDAICLDGIDLMFERADSRGYRFAYANAQCTASPAVLRMAAAMIEIAGADQARAWLQ